MEADQLEPTTAWQAAMAQHTLKPSKDGWQEQSPQTCFTPSSLGTASTWTANGKVTLTLITGFENEERNRSLLRRAGLSKLRALKDAEAVQKFFFEEIERCPCRAGRTPAASAHSSGAWGWTTRSTRLCSPSSCARLVAPGRGRGLGRKGRPPAPRGGRKPRRPRVSSDGGGGASPWTAATSGRLRRPVDSGPGYYGPSPWFAAEEPESATEAPHRAHPAAAMAGGAAQAASHRVLARRPACSRDFGKRFRFTPGTREHARNSQVRRRSGRVPGGARRRRHSR
ncbi:uncharacterized protein LOC113838691 [Cricetulus griseus]|uniref:Uncharacterized protein LOC113838691 n=1 Tax=Cricetulus griseus TaxID=10029 RepID=A0A9J7HFY0_CRIGR|nr:uncharacterized protein LOC113838691 [Cricetulus griseus]